MKINYVLYDTISRKKIEGPADDIAEFLGVTPGTVRYAANQDTTLKKHYKILQGTNQEPSETCHRWTIGEKLASEWDKEMKRFQSFSWVKAYGPGVRRLVKIHNPQIPTHNPAKSKTPRTKEAAAK